MAGCVVWLDVLSDGIFCLRHVLCVVGCFVWWEVLFGGMLCLVGCFVWWDALFGGMCLFLFGLICFVWWDRCSLVGGVLCTGWMFCTGRCVV